MKLSSRLRRILSVVAVLLVVSAAVTWWFRLWPDPVSWAQDDLAQRDRSVFAAALDAAQAPGRQPPEVKEALRGAAEAQGGRVLDVAVDQRGAWLLVAADRRVPWLVSRGGPVVRSCILLRLKPGTREAWGVGMSCPPEAAQGAGAAEYEWTWRGAQEPTLPPTHYDPNSHTEWPGTLAPTDTWP